jgi:hypothetical protein
MASQSQPGGDAKSAAADAQPSAVLDEPILADDYPVYANYLYVADGRVVRSDWHGITVRQFKGREGYSEVRRCDICGRQAIAKAEGQ